MDHLTTWIPMDTAALDIPPLHTCEFFSRIFRWQALIYCKLLRIQAHIENPLTVLLPFLSLIG